MDTLLQLIKQNKEKEYTLINEHILDKAFRAVRALALITPTKRIELILGGMGCNMSLHIYNKDHKPVATYAKFLDGKLPVKVEGLLKPFMDLQKDFDYFMELGYYLDLGTVLYNPITRTIEGRDTSYLVRDKLK